MYSVHTVGSLCFSGAGDGTLICHDLKTFKPLWAIGANKYVMLSTVKRKK